jgi:hypothetical protein
MEAKNPTATYDPSKHLMKLQGKDYLEVKNRIIWLRTEHPDAIITTQVEEIDWDKGYAIFHARVEIPGEGIAEGTGSETKQGFPAGWLEKAECVPLRSRCLTSTGFKLCYDLRIGEKVLAYDLASDRCVWTPLRAVTVHDPLPMAALVGKCFSVECTPNHSWVVQRMTHKKGVPARVRKLADANTIKTSDLITLAAPAPGGDSPITPGEAATLGWLFTDGSLRTKGNCLSAIITQSKPQTVEVLQHLVGAVATETINEGQSERTFPGGATYQCLPQHIFRLPSPTARALFAKAGVESDADLPGLAPRLSLEARRAMLQAFMMADGTARGDFGKKRHPGVMEAWRIIATLEGLALGQVKLSSVGDVPIQRIRDNRTIYASELTLESRGMAPAWCPTTDYGTWVMEQDGRVFVTGNTIAIGRALAALGYGTAFCQDFVTVDETGQGKPADTPVNQPGAATQTRPTPAPSGAPTSVTPPQIDYINKLLSPRGQAGEEIVKAYLADLGVSKLEGLTRQQASVLVDHIKTKAPVAA